MKHDYFMHSRSVETTTQSDRLKTTYDTLFNILHLGAMEPHYTMRKRFFILRSVTVNKLSA